MRNVLVLSVLACSTLFAQPQAIPKNSGTMKPPSEMQVGRNFEHQILILDGLKCTHCSFKNLTFLYSGGEFSLPDATFNGAIQLELHGAAENAMFLSSSLSSTKPHARKLIIFSSPKTMTLKNMW